MYQKKAKDSCLQDKKMLIILWLVVVLYFFLCLPHLRPWSFNSLVCMPNTLPFQLQNECFSFPESIGFFSNSNIMSMAEHMLCQRCQRSRRFLQGLQIHVYQVLNSGQFFLNLDFVACEVYLVQGFGRLCWVWFVNINPFQVTTEDKSPLSYILIIMSNVLVSSWLFHSVPSMDFH